jgi:hypothetical protein
MKFLPLLFSLCTDQYIYVVDFFLYFWHFVCSYSMSFATYTKIQIRLFSTILKLKNTVHFRRQQNNEYPTS